MGVREGEDRESVDWQRRTNLVFLDHDPSEDH